jgi:ribonuclease HI
VESQQQVSKKRVTSTLFLDIKGAFDYVSKARLIQTLTDLHLPKPLISWVNYFLTDRSIQLAFDSQTGPATGITTGIPQGSPVSPILFLLYVRAVFQERGLQLSYIDDFSISVSSNSAARNSRALGQISTDLFDQALQQNVQFDPSKTELIHFCRARTPPTDPVILPGFTVYPKAVVKWLGVYFDYRLTFKPHIEKRLALGYAVINALQRMFKNLPFRSVRQAYTACITTVTDYGVPLWWGRNRKPGAGAGAPTTILNRFQRLQNRALTGMLGAFPNSPYRALEAEARILPPPLRLEQQCDRYAVRALRFLKNHPVKAITTGGVRDELGDSESENENSWIPYIRPTTQLTSLLARLYRIVGHTGLQRVEKTAGVWEAPWAPEFPATFTGPAGLSKPEAARAHNRALRDLQDIFSSAVIYYTDGSKGAIPTGGPEVTACSMCRIEPENRISAAGSWNLGYGCTIADAETFAVWKALQDAFQNRALLRGLFDIHIFVDSAAAIQRLQQPGNPVVQRAKQLATRLSAAGFTIHITWCPGHQGVWGNEIADQLAKAGLQLKPDPEAYISIGYLNSMVRKKALIQWEQLWESEGDRMDLGARDTGLGKAYRVITQGAPSLALKPSDLYSYPKQALSAYIQLKTGIGCFGYYLSLIGKASNSRCFGECKAKQTARHLLLECPNYSTQRYTLQQALQGIPLTMQILFGSVTGRRALFTYLKQTGICTPGWARSRGVVTDLGETEY